MAVTGFATALALSAGRGTGAILVAAAVLCGQLSVGWSNDYIDRARDRTAARMDKPIVAGSVSARLVWRCALVAAAACVPLSMLSGWRAGLVHLGAVAMAWMYNLSLKNTAASVVPYALAFGALPIFVSLGLSGHPLPPGWAITAAALLGAGAHFVNTLPDLGDDALTGVRGLPHRLGPRLSLIGGTVLMASATATLAVFPRGRLGPLGTALIVGAFAAIGGVIVSALSGHPRAAWSLTLCAAGLTVAVYLANGTALRS